jgi:hypothetical protein
LYGGRVGTRERACTRRWQCASAAALWVVSAGAVPARAQDRPRANFEQRWNALTHQPEPSDPTAPSTSGTPATEGRAPLPEEPGFPPGSTPVPTAPGWPASISPRPEDLKGGPGETPVKPADTRETPTKPAEADETPAKPRESHERPERARERHPVVPSVATRKVAPEKLAPRISETAKPPAKPHEAERHPAGPERATHRRPEPAASPAHRPEPTEVEIPPLPARRETVGLAPRVAPRLIHPPRAAPGGLPAALKPTLPPDGSPL